MGTTSRTQRRKVVLKIEIVSDAEGKRFILAKWAALAVSLALLFWEAIAKFKQVRGRSEAKREGLQASYERFCWASGGPARPSWAHLPPTEESLSGRDHCLATRAATVPCITWHSMVEPGTQKVPCLFRSSQLSSVAERSHACDLCITMQLIITSPPKCITCCPGPTSCALRHASACPVPSPHTSSHRPPGPQPAPDARCTTTYLSHLGRVPNLPPSPTASHVPPNPNSQPPF